MVGENNTSKESTHFIRTRYSDLLRMCRKAYCMNAFHSGCCGWVAGPVLINSQRHSCIAVHTTQKGKQQHVQSEIPSWNCHCLLSLEERGTKHKCLLFLSGVLYWGGTSLQSGDPEGSPPSMVGLRLRKPRSCEIQGSHSTSCFLCISLR